MYDMAAAYVFHGGTADRRVQAHHTLYVQPSMPPSPPWKVIKLTLIIIHSCIRITHLV